MQKHIFNIHDVILIMTAAECILLVLFQTILPAKKQLATRLLGAFLLSMACVSASVLILWNPDVGLFFFFDEYLIPFSLTTANLLMGPLLFLYVVALTEESFQLKLSHLLHALPVLVCSGLLLAVQITSSDLLNSSLDQTSADQLLTNVVWYLIKIVPVCYALAALVHLRNYMRYLKNQYSEISFTAPRWLLILSGGFFAIWSTTLLIHVLTDTVLANAPGLTDSLGISENYAIFIFINALFLNSLAHAHKLLRATPELPIELLKEPSKEKSEDKIDEASIEKVHVGMHVHKHFLKQNLNIEEFSRRIDLPVKDVSIVINKHYGTNFFEFMNSYRIEEAKRLLRDPAHADATIMDILLEAGFNSKSAFHRFFNRLVGMSPSEFRKQPEAVKV